MFSLEDAYTNITLDDIYAKVTLYELWKYYCRNFESLDRPFLSEFYNDSNPDCRIFLASNNTLIYKDFGSNEIYDIVKYIMRKYMCNFKEVLTIISNDFNISKTKIRVNKETRLLNFEEKLQINRTGIDIVYQPFNLTDYSYWNGYKIPFTLLQKYNVFSCKYVYLTKTNKIITYTYNKNNPIYAYRFRGDSGYVYKIYFPLNSTNRWLFNGKSTNIEGYDQLSISGKVLIITKSLKDCMVYNLLGYDAISLQGEHNKLGDGLFKELQERFEKIYINYDNDKTGIEASQRLSSLYNLKHYFIDEYKDISDYVKHKSIDEAKILVTKKLEGLI